MTDYIILGIAQGIAEWLPISSEAVLVLLQGYLFEEAHSLRESIELALFLHMGTLLAALIYFRNDVVVLTRALVRFRSLQPETEYTLRFLAIATFVSALLGFAILQVIMGVEEQIEAGAKAATAVIGVLLLGTAALQFRARKEGIKMAKQLKSRDGIFVGVLQGLAALPGFSRSGLTISGLLIRKFDEQLALKLSFLLSIPIVFGANIFLNLSRFVFSAELLVALLVSFLVGIITIDIFLRLASKLNFAYFVAFFGVLTLISAFI